MVWFIIESFVVIFLAFLLGLVVGWLWWRRRKVSFGQSDAIAAINARHEATLAVQRAELDRRADDLARKDREIVRLSELLPDEALEGQERHRTELAGKNEEIARLGARLETEQGQTVLLSTAVQECQATITALREDVAVRDRQLAERDGRIRELVEQAAEQARAEPAPAVRVPEPDAEPDAEPDPEPDAEPGPEPDAEPAPEPWDPLERIDGIGPRIGAALRTAGIVSFRQLADADISTLQRALEGSGLRFAPSLPTWGRQAHLLAEGDEDGFSTLAAQLAGRDVSRTK